MKEYLALLRFRPQFRYLWLAQVVSLTGDWFNLIASVILVSRYTDSGLAVGGLFLARALPPFVFGPLAGVVADRFSRRSVLIATDLLRALIVLGFLLVNSAETAWLMYALSIAQFSVSAFFEPARAAIVPSLVEENELLAANTLASITWSAMLALGSALGGGVAAAFGAQTALVIDSLSFVASAMLVRQITTPTRPDGRGAHGSGWADFVAGMRYVRAQPSVGWVTLVKALGQVGSIDVIAAVYAERVFRLGQDGAVTLGLMFAVNGIGAVIGPLISNALGDQRARTLRRAIIGGYALMPLSWLCLGFAPSLELALIGSLLHGMGGSINWTYSDVLLQMSVPDRFLGRVFALDFGIFTLAMSASVWLTGLALDGAGDPRAIVLLLAVGSIAPLIAWTAGLRRQEQREVEAVAVTVDV
jgi:MFS family permease